MRATHRIIGFALCLAVMGPVAAASLDTQGADYDSGTRASTSRTAHDGDCIAGDVVDTSRGGGAIGSGDATNSTSHNSNDRSGAASSAPAPAPRPHLGWQSLLPGSIQ